MPTPINITIGFDDIVEVVLLTNLFWDPSARNSDVLIGFHVGEHKTESFVSAEINLAPGVEMTLLKSNFASSRVCIWKLVTADGQMDSVRVIFQRPVITQRVGVSNFSVLRYFCGRNKNIFSLPDGLRVTRR